MAKKGQDYNLSNRSMDLEEARAKVEWQDQRIASLSIANSQLKAQIVSLKNELADVLDDQAGEQMLYNALDEGDDDGSDPS